MRGGHVRNQPIAVHVPQVDGPGTPTEPHPPTIDVDNTGPQGLGNTPVGHDPTPTWATWEHVQELALAVARVNSQWPEMMELLRRPQPVWVRPSDRFTTPAGTATAPQDVTASSSIRTAIDAHRDGARVTIYNNGVTTLYLRAMRERASGFGDLTAAAPLDAFPIPIGGSVSLDTRDGVVLFTWGSGITCNWSAIVEVFEL